MKASWQRSNWFFGMWCVVTVVQAGILLLVPEARSSPVFYMLLAYCLFRLYGLNKQRQD